MEKIWAIRVGNPKYGKVCYLEELFETRLDAEIYKKENHFSSQYRSYVWYIVRLVEAKK